MSIEVQSGIANALFQLQELNQRLHAITRRRRDVGQTIGREAIGELGGALAEGIFGTGKAGSLGYSITKKLIAQGQIQQTSAQKARAEYEFRQIVERTLPLLSQVSIAGPTLKSPGNSNQLVRRLKKIASFVNLETKTQRAVQFLQSLQQEKLILNKDIPEVLASTKPGHLEAYDLLRQLEKSLRKLIEESLSRLSPDWWLKRIPDDVRRSAEERKRKNDRRWPWATGTDLAPIHYVDFPDYVKIIRRRDNWREAFGRVFNDEEMISSKLRELEPIRNAVAHSRPLPRNGLKRLRINAKDILGLLPG